MKKRRRHTRKWRIITLTLKIILALSLPPLLILTVSQGWHLQAYHWLLGQLNPSMESSYSPEPSASPSQTPTPAPLPTPVVITSVDLAPEQIYTFLQGPAAWSEQRPWSGEWSGFALAGSNFGAFGCGLCDLADVYSTLTPYECSPIAMYYYAQEASDYSPGGGAGAIDWAFMQQTLESLGFTCELCSKDESLEAFCDRLEHSLGAIALISSYDDASYWTSTEGHYINLWDYEADSRDVFLGDSGSYGHNRERVPVSYIYDALKSASAAQYLLITAYEKDKTLWQHTGIEENWIRPDYLPEK